jgi:hypothetical protein
MYVKLEFYKHCAPPERRTVHPHEIGVVDFKVN